MVRWLAWTLVTLLAVWTVGRLFGLERGYPLVPLMTFTPFVAAIAVLVAIGIAALRAWVPAVVAALLAMTLVGLVAPRALGGPSGAEGADGPTIAVLSVNLRRGGAEPDAVVALARRADFLSLQEIDAAAVDRLLQAGLDDAMPHSVLRYGPGFDGRPSSRACR